MADDKSRQEERSHKPKITVGEKDSGAAGTTGAAAPGGSADDAPDVGGAVRAGMRGVTSWVHHTFPGQEKAFWGAVVGLVAAIAFLVVGPWPIVVIAVFVLVGVAAGQALDGDPKIVNVLRHLFSHSNQ